jgi:predicted acylesterase/phospholipase RssA
MSDFTAVERDCDIVMKGGITSGVVYPLTVVEIARKYRLRNIGGTSAGALAAAITAAAEHNRSGGGFDRITKIPDEVATKLRYFFQPVRALKPIFDTLLALQNKKLGWLRYVKAVGVLLLGYWPWTLVGLIPGLVLGWLIRSHLGVVEWILVVAALLLGLLLGYAALVVRVIKRDLPANNFGLCTGKTMPGASQEALTDWLARTIDEVAGRDTTGDPLTFTELWGPDSDKPRIRLDMMTTNLSMQRAHRLPLRTKIYMFRRSEFEQLFPKRVVDYMIGATVPVADADGRHIDDYYHLPEGAKLPVVVAARMSLSFPGLICTIPLYTRDRTLKDRKAQDVPRRCLFSDGGLTSNFPIHFFDRFLPCAPTFAVTLDSWREAQHGNERVRLPERASQAINMPVRDIGSFGAFLMSLIDSAKGWQDNLQSTLPGYRERIVHVALDDSKEGGLNLAMDKETITTLVDYGRQAGEEIVTKFDFDDHRWRRFLVAAKRVEETLEQMLEAYQGGPSEPFQTFLQRYSSDPASYKQTDVWAAAALQRIDVLMNLAEQWRTGPLFRDGEIPLPDSDLRITPRY